MATKGLSRVLKPLRTVTTPIETANKRRTTADQITAILNLVISSPLLCRAGNGGQIGFPYGPVDLGWRSRRCNPRLAWYKVDVLGVLIRIAGTGRPFDCFDAG